MCGKYVKERLEFDTQIVKMSSKTVSQHTKKIVKKYWNA